MEVGKPVPSGEGVVVVIVDHGRERSLICTPPAGGEMLCASGATCTR